MSLSGCEVMGGGGWVLTQKQERPALGGRPEARAASDAETGNAGCAKAGWPWETPRHSGLAAGLAC